MLRIFFMQKPISKKAFISIFFLLKVKKITREECRSNIQSFLCPVLLVSIFFKNNYKHGIYIYNSLMGTQITYNINCEAFFLQPPLLFLISHFAMSCNSQILKKNSILSLNFYFTQLSHFESKLEPNCIFSRGVRVELREKGFK